MFDSFHVDVELSVARTSAGRLQGLDGRFVKAEKTINDIYKFKSREFLDRAADELYSIPSAERYAAWHSGNISVRPVRRSPKGLAEAIVDFPSNIRESHGPNRVVYQAFNTSYMSRVARHWASIEYGGSHNIAAAAQRRISFFEPGSGDKLKQASSTPPFVGVGVLQGKKIPKRNLRSQKSQQGMVRRPIRAGRYLSRAHRATIGPQLQNELRRRIISDLSRG